MGGLWLYRAQHKVVNLLKMWEKSVTQLCGSWGWTCRCQYHIIVRQNKFIQALTLCKHACATSILPTCYIIPQRPTGSLWGHTYLCWFFEWNAIIGSDILTYPGQQCAFDVIVKTVSHPDQVLTSSRQTNILPWLLNVSPASPLCFFMLLPSAPPVLVRIKHLRVKISHHLWWVPWDLIEKS